MLEKKSKNEIVKYNAQEIVKFNTTPVNFKHVNTITLAASEKCDSLALICKKVGKEISLSIIKVWLINLNDFLNISRKMNPVQINETAELIYDEFYFLKISDIALLMKRIKTGHYGQFYESLDGMKIMDMFYKYSQDRLDSFINNIDRDSHENKHGSNEIR